MEKYSIIRTEKAGVFAGYVKERNGQEAVLSHVRRLWYWDGATECIGLATSGVSRPKNCKFTVEIEEMVVLGVIEILPCTEQAEKSIKAVPEWKA